MEKLAIFLPKKSNKRIVLQLDKVPRAIRLPVTDSEGSYNESETSSPKPGKSTDRNVRAQKNVIPKLITPAFIRQFVGDKEGQLLELCQQLTTELEKNKHLKKHDGALVADEWNAEKKVIDKRFKRTLKIVVKLGILLKNNVFSGDERQHLDDLTQHLELLAEASVKTFRVKVTYDYAMLSSMVSKIGDSARKVLSPHLTAKTITKLDGVVSYFKSTEFLDYAFDRSLPHAPQMKAIVDILGDIMFIY